MKISTNPHINSLDNWLFTISYLQYMQLARAFEAQGKKYLESQGAKAEDIMTEVCVMSSEKRLTSGHPFVKDMFQKLNNRAAEFRAATRPSNAFPNTVITEDPLSEINPVLYTQTVLSGLNWQVPTQCLVAQISHGDVQLHLDNNKGYMGKRITLVTNGVDARDTGIVEALHRACPTMRIHPGEGNAMPFEANFIPKDAKIVSPFRPSMV